MNNPKSFKGNKSHGVQNESTKIVVSETYEGQLPSPAMMEKYNSTGQTHTFLVIDFNTQIVITI